MSATKHARFRGIGLLAVVSLVAAILLGVSAPASAEVAADANVGVSPATVGSASGAVDAAVVENGIVKMADLSKFDPTNIITDDLFYDSSAMTANEIQSFLDARIGNCQNGRCLNVLQASVSSRDARHSSSTGNLVCNAIQGGTMRVSELIYRVQVACGISAKVILVTLQKEQGLTTSRAPSDWNLNAAMGQACPDTAPCDPAFKGIGPQIVGGVTQLKTYRAAEFGKRPGNNYIGYNPNSACGGTNLNIKNWATASLYTYTPYQPNAASLRAGYGIGDGCSSYGNRNFYQYYVDWFGSTQSVSTPIVKVGVDIYVVSDGKRYHILPAVWPAYAAAFGKPEIVSASFLQDFDDAGPATRIVRNSTTGEISYVADGQLHRFASCTLVSAWGEDCGIRVDLDSASYGRAKSGAEMSSFVRLSGQPQRFMISGTELLPLADVSTMSILNGGTSPYLAEMPSRVVSTYSISQRLVFQPGRLMKVGSAPEIYLPTADGRLVHLPSWSLAGELGLRSDEMYRVSAGSVRGYTRSGSLGQWISCDDAGYYAGSGAVYPLAMKQPAGFTSINLGRLTCKGLNVAKSKASTSVFVRPAGNSSIYHAIDGTYRAVSNQSQLVALNDGVFPVVVPISAETFRSFTLGDPYLATGAVIRGEGDTDAWVVDGDRLVRIPTWNTSREYGLATSPLIVPIRVIASRDRSSTLAPFAMCGSDAFLAGGGGLSSVASVSGTGGNTVVKLGSELCAVLPRTGVSFSGNAFVTDGVRTAVSTDGGFRWLADEASVVRAAGGSAPPLVTVGREYGTGLPLAAGGPVPGEVVRSSVESSVTLVDGSARLWLANLGVLADFGISSRVRVLSAATIANIAPSSWQLNVFVACNGRQYVASRGSLHAVDVAGLGGFIARPLSEATCATLKLDGAPLSGKFVLKAVGSSQLYIAEAGRARALTGAETASGVTGTSNPRVIELDPRSLAALNSGSGGS